MGRRLPYKLHTESVYPVNPVLSHVDLRIVPSLLEMDLIDCEFGRLHWRELGDFVVIYATIPFNKFHVVVWISYVPEVTLMREPLAVE